MVEFATHTPEAALLHYLEPFDRVLFSWLENYVDNLEFVKANFHYCYMHNYPNGIVDDVNHGRQPFPFLVAGLSLFSCFLLFVLSKVLSPLLFKAYRNLRDDSDREKWNVKFVSALHAAFVFQGAFRCLLYGGGLFFNSDPIDDGLVGFQKYTCGYYTDLSRFYMAITFGYMFYDFWVCIRAYGLTLEGIFPSLVIHHFNIIISFLLALKLGMGHYYSLSFMTNEISQPFLHLSWFLIKSKVPQLHPVSIVNGLMLVLTFLGSRFFFNAYIFYHFIEKTFSFQLTNCLGIGTWTCLIHVACNWDWCWLMVKQIKGMIGKKKAPPAKTEDAKVKSE